MENRKKAALIAAGAALCVIAGIILMFVFLNKGNEDQTLEHESSEVLELTVTETQEITEVTETTTREETATNTTAAKETAATKAETAASSATSGQKHEPTPQQGGQAAPSPAQTQAPVQTQAPQIPQTQAPAQTQAPVQTQAPQVPQTQASQVPQTQAPSGNLETIYCEEYNDVFRDFEHNPLLVDKQNKTITFSSNFVKYANGFFDVRNVIDIDDNKLNLKTVTYVMEGLDDSIYSVFNGYTCIFKIPAEAPKWSNYEYWVQFTNNTLILKLKYRNFFVCYSQGMNYFSYLNDYEDGSLDEL